MVKEIVLIKFKLETARKRIKFNLITKRDW